MPKNMLMTQYRITINGDVSMRKHPETFGQRNWFDLNKVTVPANVDFELFDQQDGCFSLPYMLCDDLPEWASKAY